MHKLVVAAVAIIGGMFGLSFATDAIRTGVVLIPRDRGQSNLQVIRQLRPGFFWFGVGVVGTAICVDTIAIAFVNGSG
jgi:hypothetical protein